MPNLSVLYIVRNESGWIDKSIKSIAAVADEIVIVDTGSSDNTVQLCRQFKKTKIFGHAWQHDFSKTKNYGISQCTSDWILCLDADEMLDRRGAIDIKNAINHASINTFGISLKIVDHLFEWSTAAPESGKPFFKSDQTRLFRRTQSIKFDGRVFETVDESIKKLGGINMLDVKIHHHLWHGKGDEFANNRIAYYNKLGGNVEMMEEVPTIAPKSMQGDTSVAIVIPTFNVLSMTKECISSVFKNTSIPYTIFAIDNGGTDGTDQYLTSTIGRPPIKLPKNVGVAKAKNAGINEVLKNTAIKYVCFLDNDTKVFPDWISSMTKIMDRNESIGIVGPLSSSAEGAQNIFRDSDILDYESIKWTLPNRNPDHFIVNSVGGFCMVVRADLIRRIGAFDESFGIYGYEDLDFCMRARKEGFEIAVANQVFVEHKGRGTVLANRIDIHHSMILSANRFTQKWKVKPFFGEIDSARSPLRYRQPHPKISIVILTHNRLDVTSECINSIIDNTKNYELIVVDNGSKDQTVEWIKNRDANIVLIENEKNLGVPVARNQGILRTTGEYVVLMDNDVVVRNGWAQEMLHKLNSGFDGVGIEAWQINASFAASHKCIASTERFDYLGGACTMFKRSVYEKIGLLDEGFSPAYYEDSTSKRRQIPILTKENKVKTISINDLFCMGTITTRLDGKDESFPDSIKTLSVNPESPCPKLDIENLPEWWTNRFLSDKERMVYQTYKITHDWNGAEQSVYGINKGFVRNRIKSRIERSKKEEILAEWKPIVKLIRHKTSKPLVRIDSRFGQTECTTDHSLMQWDGQNLQKTTAKNYSKPASVTQTIECPTDKNITIEIDGGLDNGEFMTFNNQQNGNHYSFPYRIDYGNESSTTKNLFFVLGIYVAEGCCNKNTIKISTTREDDLDVIQKAMTTVFRREPCYSKSLSELKMETFIRGKEVIARNPYQYTLCVCNQHISKFFGKACGIGAYNKSIPSFIFTAPEWAKREFLRGLFQGDAYNWNRKRSKHEAAYTEWYKERSFKFSSVSLELASGLCLLLGTLGERFSVGFDDVKNEYKVISVAYRKNTRIEMPKITNIGTTDEYVYDIEVADNHTFVDAMGLLVVHNTDICIRAKKAGFKLVWNASRNIIHKEHATLIHGQKDFSYTTALSNSYERFAKKMRGEITIEHTKLPPLTRTLRLMYLGMQYNYGNKDQGLAFEHDNFFAAFQQWNKVKEMFHFDFVDIGKQIGIDAMSNKLQDAVNQFCPDAIFGVWFDENHDPRRNVLQQIRETTPTKVLSWFCDSHFRYDNFDKHWAQVSDYCITTSTSGFQKYLKDGFALKAIKSQWGASPKYKRLDGIAKDIDVSFVGQPHGDRRQIIDQIRRAGINIQTFGTGWDKRLSFEEMVEMFNRSKINLNLNNACDTRFKQIKGRNFEVPACGGLLLTETAENLDEYFNYGKEIVTYNGIDNMIEKIRYYLAHEDERKAIANAGYERTMRDHTYSTRFDHIFQKTGLI